MVRFGRPPASLLVALALVVGLGSWLLDPLSALIVAAMLYLASSIDAKPSWQWFFDPPGRTHNSADTGRWLSWRRAAVTGPREVAARRDLF